MARTRTLAQLRTGAMQIADMENSSFASSAEVNYQLNVSIARLWDKITQEGGENYFKEPRTLTTTANQAYTEIGNVGSSLNSLAASFLRLVSLEVTLGSQPQDIPHLPDWSYRHAFANTQGWSAYSGPFYTLENSTYGARVRWWPTPTAAHTVTAWIIPSAPVLASDSDTFDGVNGYEDWVMHDAAVYLLNKEESLDTAATVNARKMEIEAGILAVIGGRDHSESATLRDTRRSRAKFGASNGWGFGGFGR